MSTSVHRSTVQMLIDLWGRDARNKLFTCSIPALICYSWGVRNLKTSLSRADDFFITVFKISPVFGDFQVFGFVNRVFSHGFWPAEKCDREGT
ncbi:hypothetical protein CTI12_AA232280 [Artemisia annua]|uniref:Uncharacterized protein n=1 Tax=Artemisia annua TaxID=35608 RepID=A0A2U1NSP9_ARTAN|nr:hypothetical protein CTI12_AA232280 [Artemisia annua]